MALKVPLMPFLRPLGLPRPQTVRHFLRVAHYSTTQRCRQDAQATQSYTEDPNLLASRKASATYPPESMQSQPRPKESKASHRTRHPKTERPYPTRHTRHQGVTREKMTREPVQPLPTEQCAPNLPYFVTRTRNNQLPIYTDRKRGGNMKLTTVRKIDGNAQVLRDELKWELDLTDTQAVVNPVTGHVVLRGHHRTVVEQFLRARSF